MSVFVDTLQQQQQQQGWWRMVWERMDSECC